MARAQKNVWAERVRQWDASGLSASEFASQLGVNANTLSGWRWKLRTEQRQCTESPPCAVAKARSTPWVEVTGIPLVDTRYEVELAGGRTLLVPTSFNAASLRRLLDVLEGR